MRVPIFTPVVFALIAGMVWLALKPGLERHVEWRQTLAVAAATGFIVEGEALGNLIANERASVEIIGPASARRAILSSAGVVTNAENNGVHYFLPREALTAIGGAELDISFEVRAPAVGGAEVWLIRCALSGVADSGWLETDIGEEWSVQTVRCPTDASARGPAFDLMMWADAEGDGGVIELRRIVFRRIGGGSPRAALGSTGAMS